VPVAITCPSCGRKGRIPDEFLGAEVKCPACKVRFVVGVRTTLLTTDTQAEPPSLQVVGPKQQIHKSGELQPSPTHAIAANSSWNNEVKKRWQSKIKMLFVGILIAVLVLIIADTIWVEIYKNWIHPNYLAIAYDAKERGDLGTSEHNYKLALTQGGDDKHMAIAYAGLGGTYSLRKEYSLAEEALTQSAIFYQKAVKGEKSDSNLITMFGQELEELGICQINLEKQYDGAINYSSGVDLELSSNDVFRDAEKLMYSAKALLSIGLYERAAKMIEKGLDLSFKLDEPPGLVFADFLEEKASLYRVAGMGFKGEADIFEKSARAIRSNATTREAGMR
jgi:tetratricopeptide (TPR) repeat protein